MKKILVLAFAISMAGAWPTSAAANDCGCTAGDVTCINECTLKKVTELRKKVEANRAAAKEKLQKAQKQAKAKVAAKTEKTLTKEEVKAKAEAAKKEAIAAVLKTANFRTYKMILFLICFSNTAFRIG